MEDDERVKEYRFTEESDVPAATRMAFDFYAYSSLSKKGLKYNPADWEKFLMGIIENQHGISITALLDGDPVGMIIGNTAPWILDFSQLVLNEIWWWINPDIRGAGVGAGLLDAFIGVGKDLGATICIVGSFHGLKNKRSLEKFYLNKGFRHLERHYIKEI